MTAVGWLLLNTLQALFLCFWSVLWISLALVVSIVSGEWPLAMARLFWAPGLIRGALAEVERVPGAEAELVDGQSYMFVMNHQSMFDVPVAFATIPRNLRFVAKRVLLFVPFLGWYMWRTGMVFVDRARHRQARASLERAKPRLKKGACFLAFPEGTRTRDGRIAPFKKGPFMVALATGVPIVPVAIEGSFRALPSGGFRLRPSLVKVKIGAPIPTEGLAPSERDALVRRVRASLIDLHASIGGAGGDKSDAVAAPGEEGIGRAKVAARDEAA